MERELANTIIGSISNNDTEAVSQQRGNSLQEKEIRDFSSGNTIPRQNRLLEYMEIFSNEINMRLSEAIDSLMSVMHSQIDGAISSAVNDRVIPENKKDCRFTFDLRDTGNLSSHTQTTKIKFC